MASPFSKYEDFAGLVSHNGIDMKPTLLRVLTDFYVQKLTHTTQEEAETERDRRNTKLGKQRYTACKMLEPIAARVH